MLRRIPTPPSHVPNPASPQPSIVRQILATPWLAVVMIFSGLFLLGMMALTIRGDRGLLVMWRMQNDLQRLIREVELVDQENGGLGQEIHRLRADLDYVEKIAREELGMVRPGELVFEFAD